MPPPPGFDAWRDSLYHYVPTDWVAIVFIVLFGTSTAIHLGEALVFRLWWLLPTVVLAGVGEVIGWAGRYWSSQNYGMLRDPFLMQITTTIIAPTPLVAAYFVLMGTMIQILGFRYSRLTGKQYTIIFCTADIVALVIQAVGGGMASTADDPTAGGNIMLAGIIFQLVSMVLFVCLATEFIVRYALKRPIRRTADGSGANSPSSNHSDDLTPEKGAQRLTMRDRLLVGGMYFSILCLFIRAIYRTIELSDGWNGRVISTQVYFNVLDGMMVFLAMFTLNVLHPGFLLRRR